jgi:4-hydroxy-2-oxoheptanedioate aldolase
MQFVPNRFKQRLVAGELQIGIWASLCSPIAADVLRDSGFDWMLIDTEHSPNEPPDVLAQLQAVEGGTAEAVVRPAWNDMVLMKRVLDLGARNLLVPYVQSAEEARRAVSAIRYPPHGMRGVTGGGRASRYGRVKEYFQRANDDVCLLVQVETREALANIEAIAGVDGVDGVFIGPADLAASLGHVGNSQHAEVQAALRDGVERLKRLGKPAGILTPNEDEARRYIEWGYRFVAVGIDLVLLRSNADALARRFKA